MGGSRGLVYSMHQVYASVQVHALVQLEQGRAAAQPGLSSPGGCMLVWVGGWVRGMAQAACSPACQHTHSATAQLVSRMLCCHLPHPHTLMNAFLAASAALHSSMQEDGTPSLPALPACW